MKRHGDVLDNIDRKREKRRLICLQVDDFIEEMKVPDIERRKLEALADHVKKTIYAAKEAKVPYPVADLQLFESRNIHFPLSLPFNLKLSSIKSSCGCQWTHPVKVEILGTWRAGYQTEKKITLDVLIVMPQRYFGSRDYLNFAYFVKRAHYICEVARILKEEGMVVKFGLDHCDNLKPLLFVSNSNGSSSEGYLRIYFSPPRDFTKLSRFRPENNNLRPSICSPHFEFLGNSIPTPLYNSKIAVDVLRESLESKFEEFFREKPNFQKAYIMIRLWMFHRNFSQRVDGFSELLLAAWFIMIHDRGNFVAQNSVFDIMMAFFSSLISINWNESRLALCNDINDTLYSQFASHFDFVFLDYTGYLNLADNLSTVAMEQIRAASSDALTRINSFNEFNSLFAKNHPFTQSFDQFIRIRLPQTYLENTFQKMCPAECVNTCNNLLSIFQRRITPLLKESLAGRIINFDFFVPSQRILQWDTSVKSDCNQLDEVCFLIGIQFSAKWNDSLIRGPIAKSPEALHFREFWGEISELRKFPDNAICEAVVWNSINVPVAICKHVLQRHLKLEAYNVEERMLMAEAVLPRTLERYSTIGGAYEKLSQVLRIVNNLPLLITNIHPVSAYLRRTAPFAPQSTHAVVERDDVFAKYCVAFPKAYVSPSYLPSIEVQITMEQSGKWGDELGAIARLKTAFYIELAKVLREKHSMQAVPFDDHLIVHFNSVVFRLLIAYPKEVHIMRRLNGGKTGVPKDSVASRAKELDVVLKPKLALLLHSLSQQFEAFSDTCRLAVHWLSSHLLSDYVKEIMLETIVASVFLKPLSLNPPRIPFIGFYHFLTLIHTHNWLMKPLFVDFSNEWTEDDLDEMEKEFIKLRPVLPAMVVYTSVDRSGFRWTRDEPQPLILKRIIALAEASASLIEQHISGPVPLDLRGLFIGEIGKLYDVVIYIKSRHTVRKKVIRGQVAEGLLPVIDYDPVQKYVERLRNSFSSVALFFYNKYKGDVIGVIWKPAAMEPRDVNISGSLHRSKGSDDKLYINTNAILEDFAIIGHGIVRNVIRNCDSEVKRKSTNG